MHANEKLVSAMGADRALLYQYLLTELEVANIRRNECGATLNNGCYIDADALVKTLGTKLSYVKKLLTEFIERKLVSEFKLYKNIMYVVMV